MRNLRRKSAGGPLGGTSAARRLAGVAWRRLAMACLAIATVGVDGCASSPCKGCGGGGIGSGITSGFRRAGDSVRNTTARIFRHKSAGTAGCDTCGGSGSAVEGMPMEGSVISGGSMIQPGLPPSAPINEANPEILDPLPPKGTGTGGASGKTSSSVPPVSRSPFNNRSATSRQRSIDSANRGRGDNLARAAVAPPIAGGGARSVDDPSPLDRVPPVDLAEEIASRARRSPVPVEADLLRSSGVETSANVPKVSDLPAIRAGLDTTLAPGLKHFSGVKPSISGGSLPTLDGLEWLKEKGIKSILDLREPSEVDPTFVTAVTSRGFRYKSLPIVASRLSAENLARFNDEVTRPEGHPVYFFDTDGTRAGLLWYVHRLTIDKVDAQIASREAEELGLSDKSAWVAASKFLDSAKPAVSTPAATLNLPKTKPDGPSAARSSATMVLAGLGGPVVEWSSAGLKPEVSTTAKARASRPVASR